MVDQKMILVIDDDPDFLDYVQIILSTNGYHVRSASNFSDGLKMARETPPNLVIVDVMMSYVLDGWTVSREMRSDPNLHDIPIMMVSAVISSEDDDLFPRGRGGQIDAFMCKPLEPSELLRRVKELTQTN